MKERSKFLISLTAMLLFTGILVFLGLRSGEWSPNGSSDPILSFAYLEDPKGLLLIEEVAQEERQGDFIKTGDTSLIKGQSKSVWWVRMTLEDRPLVLTVANPTLEDIRLYSRAEAGMPYESTVAGWGHSYKERGLTSMYPTFSIQTGETVFVRLYSSYVQSYQFKAHAPENFSRFMLQYVMVIGVLLGMALAVALVHLLQNAKVKESTNHFFVFHILMMILYQMSFLGLFRLFFKGYGEMFISNVDLFGGVFIVSTSLFVDSFLRKTKYWKISRKVVLASFLMMVLLLLVSLTGNKQVDNQLSTLFGIVAASIMWLISASAARENFQEMKYFFYAFSSLMVGILIFGLRLTGLFPNNEWTLLTLLLTHTIETLLFSLSIIRHMERYEQVAQESQLAFLKAQVEPHFIYNALNVIAALAMEDKVKTRSLLLDFAEYLRYSYSFKSPDHLIPLEEELAATRAYVSLQKARFPDMLEVEYDLCCTEQILVPQFVIQPLVENAIRHGFRKELRPGKILVKVEQVHEGVVIMVKDNGLGMEGKHLQSALEGKLSSKEGVGLANIRKRLKVLYDSELKIESSPGEGTTVSFLLPESKGNSRKSNSRGVSEKGPDSK